MPPTLSPLLRAAALVLLAAGSVPLPVLAQSAPEVAPLAAATDAPSSVEADPPTSTDASEDSPPARSAIDRASGAGASPMAAAVQMGWLGALRAQVGLEIPIYRGAPAAGFALTLAPLVELYDREQVNLFPYQYWRGALVLSVGYRADVHFEGADRLSWGVALVLAHESDHETVNGFVGGSPFAYFATYLFTNTVGVRGSLALVHDVLNVTASLSLDAHVLSCTRTRDACEQRLGQGQQSFGAALDVVLRTGEVDDHSNVQLCAAAHVGSVVGVDRVAEELRVRLHAGPCIRWEDGGEWSLLGQLAIGSRTGMHREVGEVVGGGALRFALM